MTPWIKHDGGPCPVGPEARVEVRYRGRVGRGARRADSLVWRELHFHYRLAEPPVETSGYVQEATGPVAEAWQRCVLNEGRCDGEWHGGWDGHDPWRSICPRPRPKLEALAHKILGYFCACYAEAWPAKTCEAQVVKLAAMLAAAPPPPSPEEKPEWRCFHCDFITSDKAEAQVHFGCTPLWDPACVQTEVQTRDEMRREMVLLNESYSKVCTRALKAEASLEALKESRFDTVCPQCDGDGLHLAPGSAAPCPVACPFCDGKGHVPVVIVPASPDPRDAEMWEALSWDEARNSVMDAAQKGGEANAMTHPNLTALIERVRAGTDRDWVLNQDLTDYFGYRALMDLTGSYDETIALAKSELPDETVAWVEPVGWPVKTWWGRCGVLGAAFYDASHLDPIRAMLLAILRAVKAKQKDTPND